MKCRGHRSVLACTLSEATGYAHHVMHLQKPAALSPDANTKALLPADAPRQLESGLYNGHQVTYVCQELVS